MIIDERDYIVDDERCKRFAAIANTAVAEPFSTASHLVPGWHWLYTHETPIDTKLGADGHSALRSLDIPTHFTQRLWAGSEIRLGRKITVGEKLRLRTATGPAIAKNGRSGPLVFMPVQIDLLDGDTSILSEYRSDVYRPITTQPRIPKQETRSEIPAALLENVISRTLMLDEVSLFRYSALIGVSHRIHYDLAYTTEVENYPGLLIHGPLVAQMLVQHALSINISADVRSMKVLAINPSFLGSTLTLRAVRDSNTHRTIAWAEDSNGSKKMHVELFYDLNSIRRD